MMPLYYRKKEAFEIINKDTIYPYIDTAPTQEIKAMIATLYITGCRLIELTELTKDNIICDDENVKIKLHTAKRTDGKLRTLLIDINTPYLIELLKHQKICPSVILFDASIRTYQRKLLKLNKQIQGTNTNQYITSHQLRHSRASFLAYNLEATIWELRAWFGWKSAEPASVYVIEQSSERFKNNIR